MLATSLVAVAALLFGVGGQPQASQADQIQVSGKTAQVKVVRYLGYRFVVPKAWPVIDNNRNPRDCVRFDEHAVYLGSVSGNEFCPSWLLGTTESVLIQPGSAHAAAVSAEDPVARQITVAAPRVQIIATFDTDPTVIDRMLANAGLPAPAIRMPDPAAAIGRAAGGGAVAGGTAAGSAAAGRVAVRAAAGQVAAGGAAGGGARPLVTGMHYPMASPPLPAAVASYHGLGFDACAAPSRRHMLDWRRHSPYRAVGIYIGGADRACAQPNLNEGWVRAEARAGWRFIPLYAGPQAAFGELRHPRREGMAAASDAVVQARRLGFGPRTPLYYDMEAYGRRSRLSVLRFLSSWTRRLHRLGYSSGVYSSADSGIVDLARQYSRHRFAMPDVIFDAFWNGSASTGGRGMFDGHWPVHKRIHQYSGNVTQTFGGARLNVDKDVLNVRVRAPRTTGQSTAAVAVPGGSVLAFFRGGSDRLWLDRYVAPGKWGKAALTAGGAASAPSAVWTGAVTEVFYKGPSGYLQVASYRPDGTLVSRRELTMMGVLGSEPRAIAQPGGVVDVFWRGSADNHLWHGQYTPGRGWNGPQGLGGNLSSVPAPVNSSPGVTSVFWKGTGGGLWVMSRDLSGTWSAPADLGFGPLGGAPQATAQANGDIEVYWAGSGSPYLWEGFFTPGTGWRGPRDLGGKVQSQPWPVTAAGTVSVLWRGPGHQIDITRHRPGRNWNVLSWQAPASAKLGFAGSAPFATVGSHQVQAFWRGKGGAAWTAAVAGLPWSALAWSVPVKVT